MDVYLHHIAHNTLPSFCTFMEGLLFRGWGTFLKIVRPQPRKSKRGVVAIYGGQIQQRQSQFVRQLPLQQLSFRRSLPPLVREQPQTKRASMHRFNRHDLLRTVIGRRSVVRARRTGSGGTVCSFSSSSVGEKSALSSVYYYSRKHRVAKGMKCTTQN